jgi:Competence protein
MRKSRVFCISSLFYGVLWLILFNFPPSFLGYLNEGRGFSLFLLNKALYITQHMQEGHLALNFLAAERRISFQDLESFKGSGLAHLLAISGAHVVPWANVCGSVGVFCAYRMLKPFCQALQLMCLLSVVRGIVQVCASCGLAFVFGLTGSLLRVVSLTYLLKISFLNRLSLTFIQILPSVTKQGVVRCALMIGISLGFGNMFYNISFLLSALGAACAQLSTVWVQNLLNKEEFRGFRSWGVSTACGVVVTSVCMGVVLSPLLSSHIGNVSMANMLAQPVVGFLITPLSLLCLILPYGTEVSFFCIHLLDASLMIFKEIAYAFSQGSSDSTDLFSTNGQLYLTGVLCVLWSISDLLHNRTLFTAKDKFLKLKKKKVLLCN